MLEESLKREIEAVLRSEGSITKMNTASENKMLRRPAAEAIEDDLYLNFKNDRDKLRTILEDSTKMWIGKKIKEIMSENYYKVSERGIKVKHNKHTIFSTASSYEPIV